MASMSRMGRKMGIVGIFALIGASMVLYLFEHTPGPWGGGTLPGGMSDDYDSAFDRAMWWQARVIVSTVAVGFSGALFLLAGCLTWLVSWLKRRTQQLPNRK